MSKFVIEISYIYCWYLIKFTAILWSILCSSQGSVPVPRQAAEMKCTWVACPALNKFIICNTEGWRQGSRWGTNCAGVVQDVVGVYQKRFDWHGGVGGISAGDKPHLHSQYNHICHFLRHMCPPFPLRQTLSNETEVSPVFVLIGTR